MGRPKAFDRDQALDRAVQLFWNQGYDATSMTDLRKAMGIGRQSLYDTFGDKRQLFAAALDRYMDMNDQMLSSTFGPDAGLPAIRAHLYLVAKMFTQEEPRRGCMLMSTCAQVAPHDGEVAAQSQRGLQATAGAFCRVLERAQAKGEVDLGVDVDVAARYLTTQVAGMGVLAEAGASEAELIAVVDCALGAFQVSLTPSDRGSA